MVFHSQACLLVTTCSEMMNRRALVPTHQGVVLRAGDQ